MNWTVWDWLHYLLNFALVIAIMLGCLWLLKRMQGKRFMASIKGANRLQILESLSIGPRQKLMLIALDGREILIASTAQQINTLSANTSRIDERA